MKKWSRNGKVERTRLEITRRKRRFQPSDSVKWVRTCTEERIRIVKEIWMFKVENSQLLLVKLIVKHLKQQRGEIMKTYRGCFQIKEFEVTYILWMLLQKNERVETNIWDFIQTSKNWNIKVLLLRRMSVFAH